MSTVSTVPVEPRPRTSDRPGKPRKFFHDEDFDKPRAKATAKLTRTQHSDDFQEPATFLEAIEHPTHSKEWRGPFRKNITPLLGMALGS